jgi:hypothetical protein
LKSFSANLAGSLNKICWRTQNQTKKPRLDQHQENGGSSFSATTIGDARLMSRRH